MVNVLGNIFNLSNSTDINLRQNKKPTVSRFLYIFRIDSRIRSRNGGLKIAKCFIKL